VVLSALCQAVPHSHFGFAFGQNIIFKVIQVIFSGTLF